MQRKVLIIGAVAVAAGIGAPTTVVMAPGRLSERPPAAPVPVSPAASSTPPRVVVADPAAPGSAPALTQDQDPVPTGTRTRAPAAAPPSEAAPPPPADVPSRPPGPRPPSNPPPRMVMPSVEPMPTNLRPPFPLETAGRDPGAVS
jgi:hypothetical protein